MSIFNLKPKTVSARKTISILGATGSIGQNTIKVIQHQFERFQVDAITGMDNVEKLAEIARLVQPKFVAIGNEAHLPALKEALKDLPIQVAGGEAALIEAAELNTDLVVSAIVGAAGLKPTLAAIKRGADVALANKETLVVAGELVTQLCKKHNANLIPVDSEHNAVFQVLDRDNIHAVEKITLTASGGPFREWSKEQMQVATPEQAIKHPRWNMGPKISVDSATLMNKGLELIEAYFLFPVSAEQLDIVIHPQSIVHCLVSYKDGSMLAQMAHPDMCTPIAYALNYPERSSAPVKPLDLTTVGTLQFEAPDETRFPAIRLAKAALQEGGNAPLILNAANEIAVQAFLNKQIGFLDIAKIVEQALEKTPRVELTDISAVFASDTEARVVTTQCIESL